jgi:P-type conjugative transfer protein TrbL
MRATIFLLLCGIMPLANAAGMMDTLVSQVQSASGGWMTTALGYATNLFFGLAALEFAWSAIQLTLKKSELSEIMVGTLFKVMSLSFFAMVLIKAPEWIPAIINSFKAAGAGVGGTSVLSPSAVFDQGLQVAASLMQFSNDAAPSTGSMIINTLTNSGQGLGKFMLSAIIVGVASVFIILGYGLIAVQLLITLVESYLIIGGGALMLGFSGSRWTHNLSEKYFGYAISIGVKLFTIYLIIGFGDSFTQALKDTIAAAYAAHPEGPSFGDYLGVGGASLFYGVTGYMAPGWPGRCSMARWRCRCKALARRLAWWAVRRWRPGWLPVPPVRAPWGWLAVPWVPCCRCKRLRGPLVALLLALALAVASVARSMRQPISVLVLVPAVPGQHCFTKSRACGVQCSTKVQWRHRMAPLLALPGPSGYHCIQPG